MRVKICGITRLQDALAAVDCGVHALGFVFVPESPRFIAPERAGEIIRQLPPYVATVGIFVDPGEEEVIRSVQCSGVGSAQFHGSEEPAFLRRFSFPVVKAFRVGTGFDVGILRGYPGPAFLLDAARRGRDGGGEGMVDWSVAVRGATYGRIILAGGLTAGNVAEAIARARPYAVDVSRGVEHSPGIKDERKIVSFMKAVHSAAAEDRQMT